MSASGAVDARGGDGSLETRGRRIHGGVVGLRHKPKVQLPTREFGMPGPPDIFNEVNNKSKIVNAEKD